MRPLLAEPFQFTQEHADLGFAPRLVLAGADLLARKQRRLHEMRHLLIPLVPVALLLAALVVAEPDMGTATQIVVILLTLLAVAGAPMRVFAWTFGGFASAFGALAVVEPYRLARLTSFADPFKALLKLLAEKQPSHDFATPEQIAAAVLFLCSEDAAQIRGIALPVDGGWTAQ